MSFRGEGRMAMAVRGDSVWKAGQRLQSRNSTATLTESHEIPLGSRCLNPKVKEEMIFHWLQGSSTLDYEKSKIKLKESGLPMEERLVD